MRDKPLLGDGPSLKAAWQHFHRHTLPRRVPIARDGSPADDSATALTDRVQYRRAADHEINSELYPVFGTSLSELGQFGLGELRLTGRVDGKIFH
jgi:hypothetical protein